MSPHSEAAIGRTKKRWRAIFVRAFILGLVLAASLLGFASGVQPSDRPDVANAGFLSHAYYSIGLFVLGGLDLGVPRGDPAWGRTLLWFAYFAAPAVTASAVIEGVVRTIGPGHWRLRRMRSSIIVAGCGRLALLYLKRLRASGSRHPVVVVEKNPDNPFILAAASYGAVVLSGDISSDQVLDTLPLKRASRILLLTGDDFANLDAAATILGRHPENADRVIVHVSSLRFMRIVKQSAVLSKSRVFNSYSVVAVDLVKKHLLQHFRDTQDIDLVALVGFGRFGQTILGELQEHAKNCFDRVIMIDVECRSKASFFADQVGFGDYQWHAVDAEARDISVWSQLEEQYELASGSPVIVVATGDVGANVEVAHRLARRLPNALVVARTYGRSSFTDELAQEGSFVVFSVAQLLEESIPDDWL